MIAPRKILLLSAWLATPALAAIPSGWFVTGSQPKNYEFDIDNSVAAEGKRSATITARSEKPEGFGTLMQTIAADDYRGSRTRLSGALKSMNADRAQMWLRVDGPNGKSVAFDNMDDRPLSGTQEWARYFIVLDVPADAAKLNYGVLLSGGGKVWFDDFKLEKVPLSVPLTGQATRVIDHAPVNLGFEQP